MLCVSLPRLDVRLRTPKWFFSKIISACHKVLKIYSGIWRFLIINMNSYLGTFTAYFALCVKFSAWIEKKNSLVMVNKEMFSAINNVFANNVLYYFYVVYNRVIRFCLRIWCSINCFKLFSIVPIVMRHWPVVYSLYNIISFMCMGPN